MEREITLSGIEGSFKKDADTFGKMDPQLQFRIGKAEGKTEVADGAGKTPKWKATVKLSFLDNENIINVKGLEIDTTSNDDLGDGKIDVASLKQSGSLEFKLSLKGQQTGTITCKYVLKTLPPSPLLIVTNIKADFLRETKFLIKTKPYFSIQVNGNKIVSQTKKEGNSKLLEWKETLYRKIKDTDLIQFNVEDADDKNCKMFGYSAMAKQFRTLKGQKKFNVIGKNFEPLGVLTFDYETKNFVDKEESNKNQQAAKKEQNSLTSISIKKAQGKFNFDGEDIYFKFNLGPNFFKTQNIENAKKDFTTDINKSLYAQYKQNKIVVGVYDKDLINDDVLGSGELLLEGVATGNSTIKIFNQEKKHVGDLILTLECKKVQCRTLNISEINLSIKSGNDIIGSSQPYIIGGVGGWSSRTETVEGNKVKFTKPLELKYSEQTQLELVVWEQDLNDDDCLHRQKISLSSFDKENGDMKIPLNNIKDSKTKEGELSFKYSMKNQKKPETKKQQPKKQQPKKVEEKKLQEKKEQPKKTEEKGEQDKKYSQINQPITQEIDQSIDRSSLQKSKNSFKLPSISDKKHFGDRIFDKQSSSTLQNSIHVYSMPKSSRFAQGPKYAGEPSYYVDTAFKPNSGKGVGFGFGNKRQFPEWMERNMKQNPAPGAYDKNSNTMGEFRPKGPTFGISHKHYEKVRIPQEKKIQNSQERLKPIYEK